MPSKAVIKARPTRELHDAVNGPPSSSSAGPAGRAEMPDRLDAERRFLKKFPYPGRPTEHEADDPSDAGHDDP